MITTMCSIQCCQLTSSILGLSIQKNLVAQSVKLTWRQWSATITPMRVSGNLWLKRLKYIYYRMLTRAKKIFSSAFRRTLTLTSQICSCKLWLRLTDHSKREKRMLRSNRLRLLLLISKLVDSLCPLLKQVPIEKYLLIRLNSRLHLTQLSTIHQRKLLLGECLTSKESIRSTKTFLKSTRYCQEIMLNMKWTMRMRQNNLWELHETNLWGNVTLSMWYLKTVKRRNIRLMD